MFITLSQTSYKVSTKGSLNALKKIAFIQSSSIMQAKKCCGQTTSKISAELRGFPVGFTTQHTAGADQTVWANLRGQVQQAQFNATVSTPPPGRAAAREGHCAVHVCSSAVPLMTDFWPLSPPSMCCSPYYPIVHVRWEACPCEIIAPQLCLGIY